MRFYCTKLLINSATVQFMDAENPTTYPSLQIASLVGATIVFYNSATNCPFQIYELYKEKVHQECG